MNIFYTFEVKTMETLEMMPPYFLIKIGKKEQFLRKEYLTNHILASQSHVFMKRGVQFGEILLIGDLASDYFPQASIGDLLLIHHMIEGKGENGKKYYLIYEDDDFNYYAVNSFENNGERSLSYGAYINGIIIPNRDYIFLEIEEESKEMILGPAGLMIPKERNKTRTEWSDIMKSNMARCQQLARNVPCDPAEEYRWRKDPKLRELMEYSVMEIKKLEAINNRISKDINTRKYEPFKVAYLNPDWNDAVEKSFGEKIVPGDIVYMLNIACHTEIEIFGKVYIIAEVKYFTGSHSYFKKVIDAYKSASHNNFTSEKETIRRGSKQAKH